MSDYQPVKIFNLAKDFNVSPDRIIDFLHNNGFKEVQFQPLTRLTQEQFNKLSKEFGGDLNAKKESDQLASRNRTKKETITIDNRKVVNKDVVTPPEDNLLVKDYTNRPKTVGNDKITNPISDNSLAGPKVLGKIDLNQTKVNKTVEKKFEKKVEEKAPALDLFVEKKQETEIVTEKVVEQPKTIEKVIVPTEQVKVVDLKKHNVIKSSERNETSEKKTEPIVEQKTIQEHKESKHIKQSEQLITPERTEINRPVVKGSINLADINDKTRPAKKSKKDREKERLERQRVTEKILQDRRVAQQKEDRIKNTETENVKIVEQTEIQNDTENSDNVNNEIKTVYTKLSGPNVVGKIDLNTFNNSNNSSNNSPKKQLVATTDNRNRNRRRKRIANKSPQPQQNTPNTTNTPPGERPKSTLDIKKRDKNAPVVNKSPKTGKPVVKKAVKPVVQDDDVQKQIRENLARLTGGKAKSKGSKHRRLKRDILSQRHQEEQEKIEADKKILKVTEFISVSELSSLMNVSPNEVITTCMVGLGKPVTINQRLDAETLSIVAEEFGFEVEFIDVDGQDTIEEVEDTEEDLVNRPPIVTVMGHVDHGKTSLLDYIRKTKIAEGEAGGITQKIGAYVVNLSEDRRITFLDTPGHEAFTAMRARGAQVTDVAIIVIAADDNIMPQTQEAINHAQAAGVPIVFAINKIDKPGANPNKIKEALANMNMLVEEWGGKFQSQDISAKKGTGVDELLERVWMEAEVMELKANPNKLASGTIIDSQLDKGRGYVATVLVRTGTFKVGDMVLAGQYYGKIKAMYNERNIKIKAAGPSEPVLILGLNGAPQAGDKFNVLSDEREAKEIAAKRSQIQREIGIRTQKHITLEEIGRRIAIGNFQELNIIVKADGDGAVEALSASLIKLTTPEIQVNIIHKAVGQIVESDVMLAVASNAVIIAFHVRPSLNARKLAEKEGIQIRLHSVIFDAINEVKDAMQGMLSPVIREEIMGTLEVTTVFKISKVGTIAGCIVRDGKVTKKFKVRLIRDGIVVLTGDIASLKRFKDDVKEVLNGQDCGLGIEKFNDIKEGDIIEAFTEIEEARTL